MILAEPLNIDSFLQRGVRNRIYRVGIELEGGWVKLPAQTKATYDGSVILRAADGPLEVISGVRQVGEISSRPLPIEELDAWMLAFYPHIVNETCGLHVHMSFKTAFAYQKLMSPSYPATMVSYVRKWAAAERLTVDHPMWTRLAGNSPYCRHEFWAAEQTKPTEKDHNRERVGHRYTVINYCWARTNTLECRLLPMMKSAEQGIRAVWEVLKITNACLVALARREGKIQSVSPAEGDSVEIREVREIRIT